MRWTRPSWALASVLCVTACVGPSTQDDASMSTDAMTLLDRGAVPDAATMQDSGTGSDTLTQPLPDVMQMEAGTGSRSAGCGQSSALATNTWVAQDLMVNGVARQYFVRLPTGYDPSRAYPIVYQFHGCSTAAAREDNNVPIHNVSGNQAILVRGRANAMCWSTSTTGPDIPYVDAMLPAVESRFCVDTSRRFASGYSSGSFMTHVLACIRGSEFRAVATIAGGQSGSRCTGNVGALLIHDANDMTVNLSASVSARDNHLMRNGCNATAARTPFNPMPCEQYAGCMSGLPVVWCQTAMQDHSRQDSLAAPAFWNFFQTFPSR